MWFPIDFPTPHEHFTQRTLTAQATTPQTKAGLIPLSWRTMDINSTAETTTGTQLSTTSTLARLHKRHLGLAVSPSSGLWFSALFNEEVVSARNIPDSGIWRVSGLTEEFQIREIAARAGFELMSHMQMGLGLRSQSVRGDVLGSFSAESPDRVVYSGSRLGIVAGLQVNLQSLQFALRYDAPVSGKVEIRGESKVSSTPGYTGAAVQVAASSELSLSALYGYYTAAKNELASGVPSPNTSRNLTIIPMGVAVDARLIPLDALGVGISYKMGSNHKLQMDAVRGTAYNTSDPELLAPSTIEDAQKQKMTTYRLGLATEKSDWESQVFADYGSSKISYAASSSQKISRTLSYWGIGLRAGVEL